MQFCQKLVYIHFALVIVMLAEPRISVLPALCKECLNPLFEFRVC